MKKIVIQGGNKLEGTIKISGAKNAALPIMIATLLSNQDVHLTNIPDLEDINTVVELLTSLGVRVDRVNRNSYVLNAATISSYVAAYDIVSKMRASFWVLGPLLARFGEAKVSLPGGCSIGARQVDLHIDVLTAMGGELAIQDGYIIAKAKSNLHGCNFTFQKTSVGATITAILAATLAKGITNLSNCAMEPEISDLCNFLNKMGAKIHGIGTSEISVEGVEEFVSTQHSVIPDRIEAGTYLVAGAITKGSITVSGIDFSLVQNICTKLEEAGAKIAVNSKGVTINATQIRAFTLDTEPFPGFPTDMQAQFTALATVADGVSYIKENIFENRFMHVPELQRMSARINIDANVATIQGLQRLHGAEVMATDLRASVALVLAGLVANGSTTISRIYHLYRGYEDLVPKLQNCGANIEIVDA